MRFKVTAAVFLGSIAAIVASADDSFLDGTHRVGKDISPGVYEAPGGERCKWAILDGETTVRGAGRNPIVEIVAADFAFNSSGCGMWRTATEAALRERKFGMAIDAGLLLIRALNRAIGETADSTTVANIYARAREHFAASVADPNAPPLTEGIVNVYRETLDPGDGLTAAGR